MARFLNEGLTGHLDSKHDNVCTILDAFIVLTRGPSTRGPRIHFIQVSYYIGAQRGALI